MSWYLGSRGRGARAVGACRSCGKVCNDQEDPTYALPNFCARPQRTPPLTKRMRLCGALSLLLGIARLTVGNRDDHVFVNTRAVMEVADPCGFTEGRSIDLALML